MGSDKIVSLALLILRVAIAVIFLAHGLQKTFGLFGGSGITGFSGMLGNLGFTQPLLWAWIATLAEAAGGLFLLLGVLPRISAALIAIVMVVAIVKVHGPKGFFAMQGGFEYQFLILMVCISLMLSGSGKFSLFNKF